MAVRPPQPRACKQQSLQHDRSMKGAARSVRTQESNLQPPKHPGLSSLPSNPFQQATASSSTPAASGEDPPRTAPALPTQASVTSAAPLQAGPAQPSATSGPAPAEPGAGSATPFVRTGAPAVPAGAPPGPSSLKPAADPARDPRRAARAAAAAKAPQQQARQEKRAQQQSERPSQPPAAEQSQQAQQPWPPLELLKRGEAPKRQAEDAPRTGKRSSTREGRGPAPAPQDAQQQAQGSAASQPQHSPRTSQAAQEAGAGAQARLSVPPARSVPAAAADRPGQPHPQADAGLPSSTQPLGGGPSSPARPLGNGPAAAARGSHPLRPAGPQEAARAEKSLASAAHRLQLASDTPLPGPPSRPQQHSIAQPLGGGPKFVDMTLTDSPELNPHHLPSYGALLPLAPQPLQHNPWNPPRSPATSSKRSHASMGGSSPEHQGPAQRQRTISSPQRPQASGVLNGSRANFAAANAVPRGFGGRQGASQPGRGSGSQQDGFGQPSAGADANTGLPPPPDQGWQPPAAMENGPEHGAASGGSSSSRRRKRGRQGSSDAGRGRGRGRGRQRS